MPHLRKLFPGIVFWVMVAMLLPAMSLRTQAANATVSDFEEFKQAISDTPAGGVIEITQDFTFATLVTIDKSLTLKAADESKSVTLYPADGMLHLALRGGEIHLQFENVILDGNGSDGGISISCSSATIEDAVIQNCARLAINHAGGDLNIIGDTIIRDNLSTGIHSGGGLTKYKLTIIGAQITGNDCGIVVLEGKELYIEDCLIENNHSQAHGGGIRTLSDTTIVNSTIINNSATTFGGGLYISPGPLLIENSTISNNSAMTNGGGIYGGSYNSTIRDCVIAGNTSGNYGGGIYLNGPLLVEECTISDNTAGNYGGGIGGGGGVTTVRDSTITNNKAKSGGGIYDTNHIYEQIMIRGNSIVADNIADIAYLMSDPAHIAVHEANIDPTVTWTEGFDYVFNNLDVYYRSRTPIDPPVVHSLTLTEQWADGSQPDNTTTYRAVQGKPYTIDFTTPDGCTAAAQVPEGVLVDYGAGTITIPDVTADMDLLLQYSPEGKGHTVTVISRYLDGAHPEEVKTYTVPDGAEFLESYEMHPGYAYDKGGLFLDSLRWNINVVDQTLYINSVDQNYVFELNFKRVAYNVTVIVKYESSDLADSVDVYSAAVGSKFEELFPFPDEFEFIGFASDTVGVSVSATDHLVEVRKVTGDVVVTITLRAV